MIQIVDGVGVGAGKSYFVATRMLATVADGGTIFYSDTFEVVRHEFAKLVEDRFGVIMEDDQLVEVPEKDMVRIHEVTSPGTEDCPVLIILDEAQGQLNARDWNDNSKRPFFNWLCQSRHDDNDLIIISQSAQNIDKQIRRLCTEIVRTRNLAQSKVPLFGGWPYFIHIILDQDGTTKMDSRWVRHDKAIFGIYRSKSQRGKHKRLAGVIPRKQLRKVKPTSKSMKILFAIILIAAAILVWAFLSPPKNIQKYAGEEKPKSAVPSPPSVMSPLQSKSSPQVAKPDLEILEENYRGFCLSGDYAQLRTAEGWYVLGQISRHGLVEAVSEHSAKVRRSDGGVTFVVAKPSTQLLPPVPSATPVPSEVPQQEVDPQLSKIYRRVAGLPAEADSPTVQVPTTSAQSPTPAMQLYRAQQNLRTN